MSENDGDAIRPSAPPTDSHPGGFAWTEPPRLFFPLALLVYGAFFWKRLFFSNALPVSVDTLRLYLPSLAIGKDLLRHLAFLWEPQRNMGEPFLATPQNEALYPIRLLALWTSITSYQKIFVGFHALWAAIFGFRLGRSLFNAAWPSAIVALGAGFNGFFLCRSPFYADYAAIAWLPCVAWCLIEKRWIGLAAALAFQWMAGLPTFSILTLLACALFALARGDRFTNLRGLAGAGILFLGLAAVQLVPFIEMLKESMRGVSMTPELAFLNSVTPAALVQQLAAPSFLSANLDDPRWILIRFYLGPVFLALGIAPIFTKDTAGRAFGGCALAFYLLALGSHNPIYPWIPFIRIFRYPSQWLFLGVFFQCLAAAAGLRRLKNPRFQAAVVALAALDLLMFSARTHFVWGREDRLYDTAHQLPGLMPPDPDHRLFHSEQILFRRTPWDLPTEAALAMTRDLLVPSFAAFRGYREVTSHHSLTSRRNLAYVHRLNRAPADSPLFDYAGISQTVATTPEGALKATPSENDFGVIANLHPKPRVFMADGGRPVRLLEETPGVFLFEADGPGLAVVSESAYPGWRVTVDGVPETPRMFEDTFLAVELQPGAHRVAFRYRPASFRWGLGISILSLLGAAGAALRQRRRSVAVGAFA